MLKLKIKEILLAQGKRSPLRWLMENCNFTYSKSHNLLNNKQKSISFEDLSEMCLALNCTPDELFYYENTSKVPLDIAHPLMAKLKQPAEDYNWMERIQGLNPARVEKVIKFMEQLESEKQQEGQKIFEDSKAPNNKDIENEELSTEQDL